jgi:hypothetical protein
MIKVTLDRILPPGTPLIKSLQKAQPWRELSALATMIMDVSWLALSYRALSFTARTNPSGSIFAVLGSMLLLIYYATRLSYQAALGSMARRVTLLLVMIGSGLVSIKVLVYSGDSLSPRIFTQNLVQSFADPNMLIPAEFEVLIISFLIWLRGITLAQQWMSTRIVLRRYQAGIIVLLGLSMLDLMPSSNGQTFEVLAFLIGGLIAMATGRAVELGRMRGTRRNPFDRYWLLGLIVVTGIMVGLALLAGGIATEYFTSIVVVLALVATQILLILMGILVSPILLVVLLLSPGLLERLKSLIDFSEMQSGLSRVVNFLLQVLTGLSQLLRSVYDGFISLQRLKPYLLWGILFLAFVYLLRILGRHWRSPWTWRSEQEDRQFAMETSDLLQHMRDGFRRGTHRIAAAIQQLRYGRRWLAAAKIRRIYVQLMKMCEDLGFPRPVNQTPHEFLPTLERYMPTHIDDLVRITDAYVRIRYGEFPEHREDIVAFAAAWRRIREQGEMLRKSRRSGGRSEHSGERKSNR